MRNHARSEDTDDVPGSCHTPISFDVLNFPLGARVNAFVYPGILKSLNPV